MRKLIYIVIIVLGITPMLQSQTSDSKFGITFSGFIKNDFFWDSRQNVSIREGHFLLYPSMIDRDKKGHDLNSKSSFNFLSIQTRLTAKITGPDVWKAKVSALVEADFFGNENTNFADVNGFRLRHAIIKLNWPKTELLFGQYWHPMFNPNCFPGVVSFNTGAPFQAFSRNPQLRLTQKLGNFSILFTACSQRDFVSPGGSSVLQGNSSVSLRNTSIPDLGLQLHYGYKNDSTNKEFLIGIGGGYKFIAPRIVSEIYTPYVVKDTSGIFHIITPDKPTNKYKVDEQVGGYYAVFFAKYKCRPVTCKLYGAYGQNLFDLTMIGGYTVSGINDPSIMQKDYTPYNTLAGWVELMTNGKKVQAGLFAGYTQNMGTSENITEYSNTYRGADIRHVYRVSPRVIFIAGKFQLMAELEYTDAAYAKKDALGKYIRESNGVISKYTSVGNVRAIVAVQYNF